MNLQAAPERSKSAFASALQQALAEKHGLNHPSFAHWLTAQVGQVNYFRQSVLPRLLPLVGKPWSECSVLDVGCGTGGPSVAIASEGARVTGVEYHLHGLGLQLAALRAADYQVKVKFIQGDGSNLPLKDNQFDLVFCNQVVEHVPGFRLLLRELYRVLRPGGVLYASTGNRTWLIEGHSFLPFANWMPKPIAEFYVKLLRRRRWTDVWDVWPLFSWQLRGTLQSLGFRIEASADYFVSERFLQSNLGRLFRILTRPGFGYLEPFWPAVIFAARKLETR